MLAAEYTVLRHKERKHNLLLFLVFIYVLCLQQLRIISPQLCNIPYIISTAITRNIANITKILRLETNNWFFKLSYIHFDNHYWKIAIMYLYAMVQVIFLNLPLPGIYYNNQSNPNNYLMKGPGFSRFTRRLSPWQSWWPVWRPPARPASCSSWCAGPRATRCPPPPTRWSSWWTWWSAGARGQTMARLSWSARTASAGETLRLVH